ncbi:MAG: flagellar hook-basal body complex protein FliE [Fibrobacteria bacterium]|nr:flagellar hook-basal body complex protein FliE [Fibrobacteria bacterium]
MINTIGTEKFAGPLVAPAPFKGTVSLGKPKLTEEDQAANKSNFGEMFQGFVKDVNHMQNTAGESIQKLIAGEIKDPHQVMLAVGEAKMAMNLLLEIRNKVLEGFREIMQIRV